MANDSSTQKALVPVTVIALVVAAALGAHWTRDGDGVANAAVDATSAAPATQLSRASAPAALSAGGTALPDFRAIARDNRDAIVSINTLGQRSDGQMEGVPEEFQEFLRRFGQGQPNPRPSQGLGSGFIISTDGTILTIAHVVKDADTIIKGFQILPPN